MSYKYFKSNLRYLETGDPKCVFVQCTDGVLTEPIDRLSCWQKRSFFGSGSFVLPVFIV